MINITWKTRIGEDSEERFVDEKMNGVVLSTFGPMTRDEASLFRAVRQDRLDEMVRRHTQQEVDGQAQHKRKMALDEYRNPVK